ncbi:GntR family transcriptional regulator [Pararhodobacter oceanensis]|uniref:GntR family transcriptional regulator n=1 Tax=Pararhodobacter oceanensis TaxID=2172121 RepID=A0A2T8HZ97_9RHOB|nr:GntR family transcriptional regulator [Pararhodobacter oceanensis]PVH30753.1 GntR family transcriptional regulator [Pararhodobacter oceanensis]
MSTSIKTATELVEHSRLKDKMSSTAGPIYDDLRQRILSLDLPPGTHLLRNQLAAEYRVSQTPLRDALQRLQRDDLVQILPQSSTSVTRINIPKIHEAYFLRVALETEVVRHLASHDASELVGRARSVIDLQRAIAKEPGQLRLFQEIDELFHQMLFEAAGHRSLHLLIRSQSGHLDRVRRLQIHSEMKIASILAGHDDILKAIETSDEAAAMTALRDHLRKSPQWLDDIRAGHEDYFE